MFANACAWLANLANASCHNQILYASYCSVLLEFYDSMWIFHNLVLAEYFTAPCYCSGHNCKEFDTTA